LRTRFYASRILAGCRPRPANVSRKQNISPAASYVKMEGPIGRIGPSILFVCSINPTVK
jgi:hypothetical protein